MKVLFVLVPSGFFRDESGGMVEAASLRIEGNKPYVSCTMDARGGMRTDAAEYLAHALRLAADHLDTQRSAL